MSRYVSPPCIAINHSYCLILLTGAIKIVVVEAIVLEKHEVRTPELAWCRPFRVTVSSAMYLGYLAGISGVEYVMVDYSIDTSCGKKVNGIQIFEVTVIDPYRGAVTVKLNSSVGIRSLYRADLERDSRYSQ